MNDKIISVRIMPDGYGKASKEVRDYILFLHDEINKLTAESTEWESKYYEMQDNFHNANEEIERQSKAQVILDNMLADYKSRCEKAIEYINHAQNYGTMAQVMPHLKPYVNGDDLLNILQNGSDE